MLEIGFWRSGAISCIQETWFCCAEKLRDFAPFSRKIILHSTFMSVSGTHDFAFRRTIMCSISRKTLLSIEALYKVTWFQRFWMVYHGLKVTGLSYGIEIFTISSKLIMFTFLVLQSFRYSLPFRRKTVFCLYWKVAKTRNHVFKKRACVSVGTPCAPPSVSLRIIIVLGIRATDALWCEERFR